MATRWKIEEHDDKLRELVTRATHEGPQPIEDDGREVAVVVSLHEFERLKGREGSLVEFFRRSPLIGVDLDLERDADTGEERDVELPD